MINDKLNYQYCLATIEIVELRQRKLLVLDNNT